MKQVLIIISGILIAATTNCEKVKDNVERGVKGYLAGVWEVKSFAIGGLEAKGPVVTGSDMEFEARTVNSGDFEWNIHYIDGSSETQSGHYVLGTSAKEIEFENKDGERLKFEFELDGDKLELSGTIDGERSVLKAERD